MEEKKKTPKGWMIWLSAFLVILACVGLYLLWGLKDYMDKVPKITPKENVTAKSGQVLTAEDIFDIECKGSYEIKLSVVESDISDAKAGDEKQTIFTGTGKGTIRVLICASGEVAESADAENVVTVEMME